MHESLKNELDGLSKMLAALNRGSDGKSEVNAPGVSVVSNGSESAVFTILKILRPCPVAGP